MSYMLEIPDELYAKLKKEADAHGTTLVDWIAAQLSSTREEEHLEPESEQSQKTLADLLNIYHRQPLSHLPDQQQKLF